MIQPSRSFLESFDKYCEDIPTPKLFVKWAGIATLAGALERRVWAVTRRTVLVPNFIILLVSPPGIGKTRVIVEVHEAWLAAGDKFNVSPTSVTRAALIDQLAEKIQTIYPRVNGMSLPLVEWRSILVAAPEFGVFCPSHDLEFLNTINDLYDCRKNFLERRRSLKDVITIPRPHINIIAGTQPSFLGELLPDAAYGMGFTSRCIMVYQGTGPSVPIFTSGPEVDRGIGLKALGHQLIEISQLYGQVLWDESVQHKIQDWVDSGMNPVPDHARLTNYNTRRDLHLLKLCIVSCTSRGKMTIDTSDFDWALSTLLEAEHFMPDVFRDMVQGPDTQIIGDLAAFVRFQYAKNKIPISESRITHFLSSRVPSNRILDLIATCVRADILDECPTIGSTRTYIPGTPDIG